MKINLAKSAGFCFGVRRALKIAMELANSGVDVEMLGDIVHNEEVVKEIKKAGIKKIPKLRKAEGKIFLVPAHGTGASVIRLAKRLNYKIVDATCPMVKEIHKIASDMERKGYRIAVIGDKNHAEVRGISGQLKKKALIIDPDRNIPFKQINQRDKLCAVVQSTQDMCVVSAIVKQLGSRVKKLKFFNTICSPTRIKQQEIKTIPLENDVMIIIGSKNSANTKRLYQISKSLNKKSYWINSKEGLKRAWFKNASSVGISAGASTPENTIQGIVWRIKKLRQH